jgi:hypothetical protein
VDFDVTGQFIDHIFCIRQKREEKRKYTEAVYQPFINFKKAFDSFRWEVMHNILTELVFL